MASGSGPIGDGGHGGDGRPEGDPVTAELRAVFAAALTDEPPSTVTPLSVLHAARLDRAARQQRRAGRIRRWGMAAGAAAAVVAAVVLLGPALGNRSGPSSGVAGNAPSAAAGTSSAAAASDGYAVEGRDTAGGGSAGSGAAGGVAAGSAGSAPQAGGQTAAGAGSAGADTRAAASPPGGTSAAGPVAGGTSAAAGTSAAGPGAGPGEVSASTASAQSAGRCPVPALEPGEQHAAIGALPAGSVTGVRTGADAAAACAPGAVRGAVLTVHWPSATVTIVVTTAGSGAVPTPPAHAPDGSRTVDATAGGVRVTVTANPAAAAHLTAGDLGAVAAAVAHSAG